MAKRRYLLAIDQGTTGTHVLVVDDRLEVVGEAYREFTQHFPRPGWVEHDLREIWKTVERCCKKGLADAEIRPDMVTAIGITNQRETTAVWHRETGEPLARAIVWQDRRTAEICAELKAKRRGGTGPRDDRPGARPVLQRAPSCAGCWTTWTGSAMLAEAGALCFGTIDSWLVYRLTAGAGRTSPTPPTPAAPCSTTCAAGAWSEAMIELFGIPSAGPPGDPQLRRGLRHDQGDGRAARRHPGLGHGGRPAGGAVRSGLLPPGRVEVHLRDGQLPADEHRARAGDLEVRAPDDGGLAARGHGDLRARGLELRRRRGGAVAPRRAAGDQEVGAGGEAGPERGRTRARWSSSRRWRASARRTGGPRRAGS